MRIGFGYDNHRLTENRPLYLGGLIIPSDKGEDAHSDGDVLLHALIDALFGAMALGDIGDHFPPSDERYKDISSVTLLKETLKETKADIINVDITIILEKTKLKDHKVKIKENVASLLGINSQRVSIKAKTHEKVDATGKGDAIECYAAVLLSND